MRAPLSQSRRRSLGGTAVLYPANDHLMVRGRGQGRAQRFADERSVAGEVGTVGQLHRNLGPIRPRHGPGQKNPPPARRLRPHPTTEGEQAIPNRPVPQKYRAPRDLP